MNNQLATFKSISRKCYENIKTETINVKMYYLKELVAIYFFCLND